MLKIQHGDEKEALQRKTIYFQYDRDDIFTKKTGFRLNVMPFFESVKKSFKQPCAYAQLHEK